MQLLKSLLALLGAAVLVGVLLILVENWALSLRRWWEDRRAYSREDIKKIKSAIAMCLKCGDGTRTTTYCSKYFITVEAFKGEQNVGT